MQSWSLKVVTLVKIGQDVEYFLCKMRDFQRRREEIVVSIY